MSEKFRKNDMKDLKFKSKGCVVTVNEAKLTIDKLQVGHLIQLLLFSKLICYFFILAEFFTHDL